MGRLGPGWWLLGAGAMAAAVALRHWDPSQSELPTCLFRALTGFSCPGCGLTRAAAELARGSFAAAIGFHPMAPAFALEALALWAAGLALGRHRLGAVLAPRAEMIVALNAVPFISLWLGRAATGSLPL